MMLREPVIGEPVVWATRRPIWGKEFDEPKWFIVTSWPERRPGKVKSVLDLDAAGDLVALGVKPGNIWAPTNRVIMGRGKNQFIRHRLIVSGYLFALMEREPAWDLLIERAPRHRLRGVVSVGGVPYEVPLRVLSQMAQMPDRLRELKAEEDAALAARLPKPGQQARLTTGPLAGYMVDIKSIDRGIARFLTLHGVKGEASITTMERVA